GVLCACGAAVRCGGTQLRDGNPAAVPGGRTGTLHRLGADHRALPHNRAPDVRCAPARSAGIVCGFTSVRAAGCASRSSTLNKSAARGRGRLFVISAPSGAGKTSLVRALMARERGLRFSISCTTRARRENEVEGRDYFFVRPEELRRIAA